MKLATHLQCNLILHNSRIEPHSIALYDAANEQMRLIYWPMGPPRCATGSYQRGGGPGTDTASQFFEIRVSSIEEIRNCQAESAAGGSLNNNNLCYSLGQGKNNTLGQGLNGILS